MGDSRTRSKNQFTPQIIKLIAFAWLVSDVVPFALNHSDNASAPYWFHDRYAPATCGATHHLANNLRADGMAIVDSFSMRNPYANASGHRVVSRTVLTSGHSLQQSVCDSNRWELKCQWYAGFERVKFLPVLLIDLCLFDALILGPTILEPNFYLRFSQLQAFGQFETSATRYVFISMEFHFEAEGLFTAKCGALSTRSSFFSSAPCHCKYESNKNDLLIN